MPSKVFYVKEHIIASQHIREYAHATAHSQEEVLRLAVKQYIPQDNTHPKEGDVTIIGAAANGFPKELYEPLWEDLHTRSKNYDFRIRSIWIADIVQQGASGVLNEPVIGNDPSWLDHARDLLYMINHFRTEMPRPIIGIGHSFGANILANLAFMHPRLLSTIIMLDPVIQQDASAVTLPNPARASTFRNDIWPSRAAAEASFRRSAFCRGWDNRVFDLWVEHGLRETPTLLHRETKGSVTLTTTKHQECFSFLRPSWEGVHSDGTVFDRRKIPDMHPDSTLRYPFYRPENPNTLLNLERLRPSVCYIFGGSSPMSSSTARELKMKITGSGCGGSGGAKEDRVKEVVLEGVGHLVAIEASTECANAAAPWIDQEMRRCSMEREDYLIWVKQKHEIKTTLSEEWRRKIGGHPGKLVQSKL